MGMILSRKQGDKFANELAKTPAPQKGRGRTMQLPGFRASAPGYISPVVTYGAGAVRATRWSPQVVELQLPGSFIPVS